MARAAWAPDTLAMQFRMRYAVLGSVLFASCSTHLANGDSETEAALRARLQTAHDATLQLELRARLDAAAVARGVREVLAWCDEADFTASGSVAADGALSIAVPSIEVHDRCLTMVHVVDHAGGHWYSWFDLTKAPPNGRHDLGELRLQREPAPLLVVDDRGRALPGARVLLYQQYPEEHPGLTGSRLFETTTDEHGRACWCRAAPFDATARLVVRHEDFAPWSGPLSPQVELDHGGEVRGRVVVPADADPRDYVVGVWVEEASPQHIQGDEPYARVTAAVEHDSTYHLRNVPHGARIVHVVGAPDWVKVKVGSSPALAPELSTASQPTRTVPLRVRVVGHDGRAPIGPHVVLWPSDAGIRVPMHNGYFDWENREDAAFAISVPGYGWIDRSRHRAGEVLRLPGGHRVALRLAIEAARRLPAGCALRAGVEPIGRDAGFPRTPVLYPDTSGREYTTPLGIARDAHAVVDDVGRHRVDLVMVRWNAEETEFVEVPIDVEPREFEVHADDDVTIVTVSSQFAETPR